MKLIVTRNKYIFLPFINSSLDIFDSNYLKDGGIHKIRKRKISPFSEGCNFGDFRSIKLKLGRCTSTSHVDCIYERIKALT